MKDGLKGAICVFLGAASYGILATIVKYSNHLGIHTSILTVTQFFTGLLFLTVYAFIKEHNPRAVSATDRRAGRGDKTRLLFWGISLGTTTLCYYLAIQYIPVSTGIILLMQSIWMSIVLEWLLTGKRIGARKIAGAVTVLIGTVLATDLVSANNPVDWRGLLLGLGAAVSYTITMYASSNVANGLPGFVRSKYLVSGGLIVIALFWNITTFRHFSMEGIGWGVALGVFGTILPPLCFTAGIPKTGLGLGSIIASVEIPVSVSSAFLVLHEKVVASQWLGIGIIIAAVVIVNSNKTKAPPGR
ncbi:hypothetical protein A8C56_11040 [Niabella ginsenosidivorans]|uniref:EamA domain-containing protein n=1 Tax=Niabella ginsenosidivorans TaxID=1176587 RepID=A0A1A9I1P1_9BACT|nr:EamA family transporter [Niabella ginsenosidivorans]ANH81443.1 hypothetical protein A8C56_11040 [Niabella ginsenosidivorans]